VLLCVFCAHVALAYYCAAPYGVVVLITVHDRTTYIGAVVDGWARARRANETTLIVAVDGHPLGDYYDAEIRARYAPRFAAVVVHYMDVHDRRHSSGENLKKAWLASLIFAASFAPRDDTVIIKSEDDWYPARDAIVVAKHSYSLRCERCAFVNIGNWVQF
jgi:hypothetical protein